MNRPILQQMIQTITYHQDPTEIFNQLCFEKPATLLFESAEIDNKQGIKSIMIVDSALKIIANAYQVNIIALTKNGQSLLPHIQNNLPKIVSSQLDKNTLQLIFPPIDQTQDEDSKLKSLSIFDALRFIINSVDSSQIADNNAIFLGGLFGYDLVTNFENIPQLNTSSNCPDYCFYLAETLLEINHKTQIAEVKATLFSDELQHKQQLTARLQQIAKQLQTPMLPIATQALATIDISCNINDTDFNTIVKKMQDAISQGEIFQVVPSRRFTLPCPKPLAAYQVLKQSNPSPYMFYMQDEAFTLFGASPESALKYTKETNQVEIYPIAGTRPRGRTVQGDIDYDLDCRLELDMRTDKKELAEHLMLVDLARNDLARICIAGTRYTKELLNVDRYSFVMHLVSKIVGQLRPDLDALHAYQATMNMGTLTGAPKVRAMQLIAEVEKQRRGSYGGAIGYINGQGDFDTCIVIRSAYIENNIATVQAGCGVVLDSNPQSESDETRAKTQAVINAILASHQIKMPLNNEINNTEVNNTNHVEGAY